MSKQIPLTQGKVAVVDDEEFEWLNRLKWSLTVDSKDHEKFYARRITRLAGRKKQVAMHRLILGIFDPQIKCDHKNGDSLDNQRLNLRVASTQQNAFNTRRRRNNRSGFRGVAFHKATHKWRVQIRAGGINRWLGLFSSPEEASKVYEAAAREVHGEFYRPDCIITRLSRGMHGSQQPHEQSHQLKQADEE